MSLFESFTLIKCEEEELGLEPLPRIEYKLPCVGDGCLYTKDNAIVLATSIEECEEWGDIKIVMDDYCDGPPDNHWLGYELENLGFEEILGIYDPVVFLLEHGIAPYQRFYIDVSADYYTDYWGEHDVSFDWKVLNIEYWEKERVATEWEALLFRRKMLL